MAFPDVVLNSKTYTYRSYAGGILTYNETSGGIPTGFGVLTFALRAPDKTGGSYRADVRLSIPVVATEDSACSCTGTVLRKEIVRILVELPDNGTTAERTNAQVQVKDLAADTDVFIPLLKDLVMPGG